MRELIDLVETALAEATPSAEHLAPRYFHGTASEAAAKAIMQNGLQPPNFAADGRTKDTSLRPVEGKVYVTSHISYAQMYAIGGNMAGNTSFQVPYEGNEDRFKHVFNNNPNSRHYGRFGFVFVITPQDLHDVQPDEDSIGEIYRYLKRNSVEYADDDAKKLFAAMTTEPAKTASFLRFFETVVGEATRRRILQGEYAWSAKAGKTAVKKMPDAMKLWLVQCGCHVAHGGELRPSECWKLDKAKIGWLEKDGSNFFEIAERVS